MTAFISPPPRLQFFTNAGVPMASGLLYTYAAGTTTPLVTYTDSTGLVANTNPVILDSRGEASIWLSTVGYKFKLATPANVDIWTQDNIAPGSSANMTYTPAGSGAVTTTVQAKLRESVSVKDFGATGNGSTDDTAAIQAAITATQTAGGGVIFLPLGTYKISSTLTITGNGVVLEGAAYNTFHDTGVPVYPVSLSWAGGASPMVSISTTSATIPITTGCGLINLALFGNALATVGVYLNSVKYSEFTNVYVNNVIQDCYILTSWDISTGEATATQQNIFTNCTWRTFAPAAVRAANGMRLTAQTPGGGLGNASFNLFNYCVGQTYAGAGGGVGLLLEDADNNSFFGCRVVRSGTTTYGLSIRAGDTNIFYDFSCGGANGIEIRGTASGYAADQIGNCFWNADDSNGTQYPTLDANCRVQWHALKAGYRKTWTYQSVIADSTVSAQAGVADLSTSSLRVINASDNHIVLTDATNTNQWGINIGTATGNLRMTRLSGTGSFSPTLYATYTGATGFGAPTGAAVVANFPGATATLLQTSQSVAEILVVLKGLGFIAT